MWIDVVELAGGYEAVDRSDALAAPSEPAKVQFRRSTATTRNSRRPNKTESLLFANFVRTLFLGGLRRSNIGLGIVFGLGLFEVLDRKLELLYQQLAAIGGLPELLASRLRQHQLQSLDLEPADSDFALRQGQLLTLREDHRMRSGQDRREVIRKASSRGRFKSYSPLKIAPENVEARVFWGTTNH